jgi:hypothetical protein
MAVHTLTDCDNFFIMRSLGSIGFKFFHVYDKLGRYIMLISKYKSLIFYLKETVISTWNFFLSFLQIKSMCNEQMSHVSFPPTLIISSDLQKLK